MTLGAVRVTFNSRKGENMKTTTSTASHSRTGETTPLMGRVHYKTIAIYPNLVDVGGTLSLLNKECFTDDQISLLGVGAY